MIKKIIVVFILMIPLISLSSIYIPFPKNKLEPTEVVSFGIYDRNNILLREVLSAKGGYCSWKDIKDLSPPIMNAYLTAEDRYFFIHNGINLFSIGRALIQNIKGKQIISGASTITQQLVRNIYHGKRNIFSKAHEAWLALRLERTLSKKEIFLQYINRICFGNQVYGIEAASLLYFNKSSSDLSLAESAFLAGIPRSPAKLNPYSSINKAKARQKNLLKKMHRLGLIQDDEFERALTEELNIIPPKVNFRAPHFCQFILNQSSSLPLDNLSSIHTTLDIRLQEKVKALAQNHIKLLEDKAISNGAVVVIKNDTGEILCMLGSKNFFEPVNDGQVNGALSLRQPGSTLKPFTYALALEKGMTAAHVIEDSEFQLFTPQGPYRPRNYDKRYHGPIRLRSALACSYNIPAVFLLHELGTDLLYQRLKTAGFTSLDKSPNYYGVGLTLGNGEVTLLELVQGYSAFSNRGVFKKAHYIDFLQDANQNPLYPNNHSESKIIFSTQVSYIITHILSENDSRIPAFGYNSPLNLPFPCAVKTGTSKDFRDNWTIGYTPRYTVGVWVGNFDGTPMHNVSGITGCGPLFKDIMLLLEKDKNNLTFKEPDEIVIKHICPLSGKLASPKCPGQMEEVFIQGTEPDTYCPLDHLPQKSHSVPFYETESSPEPMRISFPVNGDVFKVDPVLRKEFQIIRLRAHISRDMEVDSIEWWLNDKKIGISSFPFIYSWNLKPGSYKVKVKTKRGEKIMESSPVAFTVLSPL